MAESKAKIDLTSGSIELEGSEAFVTKYLDEFKALLKNPAQVPHLPVPKGKSTEELIDPVTVPSAGLKEASKSKRKGGAPRIEAEKYDVHGGGEIPSLKDFFSEKNPGKANGDRIAAIGYYVTEVLKKQFFTEGQIEYSYKMLGLDRPGHLHQIMINNKNEKDYYEECIDGGPGCWRLTRGGDIFVSNQLPRAVQ